ncbi:hypothetical protein Desdi_0826 [Desulfitobacterium dichloroeliminans LMG P-21439]|uniref:Hemerythrin-like domain-containing protein n=1 Tax=Desulfitobacterium dichloroeliminans (strain LMG P-21439 / DCA1) TaxID=871963 RepID=L0F6R4_DESDL|nr:hemerythrin domain-containing protein [Desulfitobacterium dichloroeliminans]AGA68351.1 hypothetical protein Desdi_0826 [Desulfitobacterium dichloroeliminans LMG P-21439]
MSHDLLKKQHTNIRQLVQEIDQEINSGNLEQKAFDLSLKISKLSGILVLHLKSEDDYLYPNLKGSANEEMRKTAQQLYSEMGTLAADFMKYKSTYMSATKIKDNIPEFQEASKKIISALTKRLDTEDRRIYQLI